MVRKEIGNENEKGVGRNKEKKPGKRHFHLYSLIGVMAVLFVGAVYLSNSSFGGMTTYLGAPPALARTDPTLKVLPSLGTGTGFALFDIILTIPEKSQVLSPGEELLLSVELTNFGEQLTTAKITYIITRADGGEIVFIEHESKEVKAQAQFLKTLALQELPLGKYYIYAHLLYGESTATASGEFTVMS